MSLIKDRTLNLQQHRVPQPHILADGLVITISLRIISSISPSWYYVKYPVKQQLLVAGLVSASRVAVTLRDWADLRSHKTAETEERRRKR